MGNLIAFASLMQKGKIVNYFILAIYFFIIIIIAERIAYFILTYYKKSSLIKKLKTVEGSFFSGNKISAEDFKIKELKKSNIIKIVHTFFKYKNKNNEALNEALERTCDAIIKEQEKGLIFLSRISAVAPLLGLLGTVTGLMTAFQKIAQLGGSVDIAMLSGGIWEAMITTATGLVTAITAFSFYELFLWISTKRIRDIEYTVSVLMQFKNENWSSKNEEV